MSEAHESTSALTLRFHGAKEPSWLEAGFMQVLPPTVQGSSVDFETLQGLSTPTYP